MISKLKQKSIQKAYEKLIKKNSITKQNNAKINSVAILLDKETLKNIVLSNIKSTLPFKEAQITVLILRKFDKKQEVLPEFFSDNDFGFKASLKSDNLKDFVKNDYDLLINYTKEPNLYTNMITLLSQAKLKAGFANIDDRLFDLVVSEPTFNEAILNQELKKYLTILNKI